VVSTVISGRSTVGVICSGIRVKEITPNRRARIMPTITDTG
jgi:hypothetical protein